MTARPAERTLIATPPRVIDVVLGTTADGTRQANVAPSAYRLKPIALRDPDVIRGLIVDLQAALEYVEHG